MSIEKIAIVGASGFGREVKMLIDQINLKKKTYDIIGFYDDNTNLPNQINGIPLLGKIEELNTLKFPCSVAIAVADPTHKEKIYQRLTNKLLEFPNLIHPSVIMGGDNVTIGKGNIICAGVIITVNIDIKDFIIFNLGCTVGHDSTINSFSSFMPSVNISGEVMLEKKVYVGTGAKIINNLTIGENTIVGAGAVVSKSLPANCTAVGVPAKPIKFKSK